MKEHWFKCKECSNRASGLWSISIQGEVVGVTRLCAQCGLYTYVRQRVFFIPTIKLDLLRTLGTGFNQSTTPPNTIPEKSWVEHPLPPERRLPNGRLVSEILKANAVKRHGKSTVHPSILPWRRD